MREAGKLYILSKGVRILAKFLFSNKVFFFKVMILSTESLCMNVYLYH